MAMANAAIVITERIFFMMQFLYLWFSIVVDLLNVMPIWLFRYLTELKNTLETLLAVVCFASTL